MPRANRYHLPHYVWHLTHRCHQQEFLLKFIRDRRTWVRWLHAARTRYGLCVLDYTVTCNHIHLLVEDQGHDEIARSMQLIAGQTAQAYNLRKGRHGAFWEDRYHATAVESGVHLARCLTYIDLNMVRAGVVRHPAEWTTGGYQEIQSPPPRYRIIDRARLAALLGLGTVSHLAATHREWVDATRTAAAHRRVAQWSESIAVGSRAFVEQVGVALGNRAQHRRVEAWGAGASVLREFAAPYGHHFRPKNGPIRFPGA